MPSEEDINRQQNLLAIHRGNLVRLLEQAAMYGGEIFAPSLTANSIQEARASIRQLKAILRGWDIFVDDRPEDEASSITPNDGQQPICPYPGMPSFRTREAEFFFGREDEVRDILLRLRHQQFLCLTGSSGSGKTSLIMAGLLPKLLHGNIFPKDYWYIKQFRPGDQPTQTLSRIIEGDMEQPGQAVNTLLAQNSAAQRLLIIVDQFEELFLESNQEEQNRFITALKSIRSVDNCTVLIIISSDFYPKLKNSLLWPIEDNQHFNITSLQGESLRRAITAPAGRVGISLEAELVARLLADAVDEPGVLPFLQETMVLLWASLKGKLLTLEDYERLGRANGQKGMAVALAIRADETYNSKLSPPQQAIARRIFLRLVQFAEDPTSRSTRRRQPIDKLRSATDDPVLFDTTVQTLANARLLTLGSDPNGTKQVDMAHQALINGWPKLRTWIAEKGDAENTRRSLEAMADRWVKLGRNKRNLLSDSQLQNAEKWLTSSEALELGYSETLPALVQVTKRIEHRRSNRWKLMAAAVPIVLTLFGFWIEPKAVRVMSILEARKDLVQIAGTSVYFSRDEVSDAQYARCVDANACSFPKNISDYNASSDKAVENVTAFQAAKYCQWVGLRLLTVDEWNLIPIEYLVDDNLREWTRSSYTDSGREIWENISQTPYYLFVVKKELEAELLEPTEYHYDLGFRCARNTP